MVGGVDRVSARVRVISQRERMQSEQPARARRCACAIENGRESLLRVVFAICVLCFAAAIYSGHRIVSETRLPRSYPASPISSASKGPHRDSIASLEQEQRIRASQLEAAGTRPSSTLDTILEVLRGR